MRRRAIRSAEMLLRLALAYGPGGLSLRTAAAWAGVSGLADLPERDRRLGGKGDVASLREVADRLGLNVDLEGLGS